MKIYLCIALDFRCSCIMIYSSVKMSIGDELGLD